MWYCEGVKQTVDHLKSMGIKIGSCTGFSSDIVSILKEEAAKQGYVPDAYVAADEVPASRPLPHMVWLNLIRMNVAPIEAVVKVCTKLRLRLKCSLHNNFYDD